MINIRHGLFETNSSSTHSLVVMTKKQYHDWQNGENSYIELQNESFITPDKIHVYSWDKIKELYKKYNELRLRHSSIDDITDNDIKHWAKWAGYVSSEDWFSNVTGELEDYIIMSFYLSE